MAKYLRVKRLDNGEEIHKMEVTNPTQRKVEKIMSGMLINMNTECFYIDDSDFDDLE